MGNKKMGRPTDNPKHISLKVMLDNDTDAKLSECIASLQVSKAEVIRRGIHRIHEDTNKK